MWPSLHFFFKSTLSSTHCLTNPRPASVQLKYWGASRLFSCNNSLSFNYCDLYAILRQIETYLWFMVQSSHKTTTIKKKKHISHTHCTFPRKDYNKVASLRINLYYSSLLSQACKQSQTSLFHVIKVRMNCIIYHMIKK